MDERAFESMFLVNWTRVHAYLLRRVRDRAVAEDIAAETFAVAWRRVSVLPADPLPWLLRTAANLLANQRRVEQGQLTRAAELALLEPGADRSADDAAAARDELRELAAAFQRLPVRDRELLALVHWDGLEARQAARVVGMTAVAARARLSRARRRLRAAIDRYPHPNHLDPVGATDH
jgi:RNA polymerase sigma factor (sigma-70 family)